MEIPFQNSFMTTAVLVLVLFFVNKVQGFPSGAPLSACSHLMPVHIDGVLQDAASPYILILNDTTYNGNDVIQLTVSTVGPSAEDFMAFMLQARTEDGEPAGYFSNPPPASKTMTCYETNDTLTHTAAYIRSAMNVIWHPPTNNVGRISIIGSVAQSKITYWAVQSSELTGTGPMTTTPGSTGGSNTLSVNVGILIMLVMTVIGKIVLPMRRVACDAIL